MFFKLFAAVAISEMDIPSLVGVEDELSDRELKSTKLVTPHLNMTTPDPLPSITACASFLISDEDNFATLSSDTYPCKPDQTFAPLELSTNHFVVEVIQDVDCP